MSLLSEIRSKTLKPTSTTITRPDGKKFLETPTGLTALPPCAGYVVDTKPDNIPAEILPTIFLGSQDCCDLQTLTANKIDTVLSVGVEAPLKFPHVNYHFVECLDLPETKLVGILEETNRVVEGGNVLVHCNAGVSRSASVLIGYLITKKGLGYAEALGLVKKARSCVKPNVGFEKQLRDLRE